MAASLCTALPNRTHGARLLVGACSRHPSQPYVTLRDRLSVVLAGAASAAAQPQPKRQPDATVLLADTCTITVDDHAGEAYDLIALFCHDRPGGGGTGTLLKLRDVLLLCGCPKGKVDRSPAQYLAKVIDDADDRPPTRLVMVKGYSTQAQDFVFVEGAIAIIVYRLCNDLALATSVMSTLLRALDQEAAMTVEEGDEDTVAPSGRRFAGWFASLDKWRGFLRQLLSTMRAEQLSFVHEWAFGIKAALSTSASSLSHRIRHGTAKEAASAQRTLTERSEAAWALLGERLAVSQAAKERLSARSKVEAVAATAFAEAEEAELERRRTKWAAEQAAQSAGEPDEEASEEDSLLSDSDDADEAADVAGRMPLSKVDRRALRKLANEAAAKVRQQAAIESRRAETAAAAHKVDGLLRDSTATSLFTEAASLFGDDDPDELALCSAMFRNRRDFLVRLETTVARQEGEEAVKYRLRQAYLPRAVMATAQTRLAANIGGRFMDTVLGKYWEPPFSVYGLATPFSKSPQVDRLFEEGAKIWDVQATAVGSPDGSTFTWSGLETAGAQMDPQQVLQTWLDVPTVEACIDVSDDPEDPIFVKFAPDGRRDGKKSRCLWTATVVNSQNTALAVSSAHTVALADGDDHAGSLPHASRLIAFIRGCKDGSVTLRVRMVPHPVILLFSGDSVALYEQSMHSSALATFAFPQCGAHKDNKGDLNTLLSVTHTTRTQSDMHEHTHQKYSDAHDGKSPPKSRVDEWARLYEGIRGRNDYNLDMRWWFKGPLHAVMRGFQTSVLMIGTYFHALGKLDMLNDHWSSQLKLRTRVIEVDGKLVVTMQGNAMRAALRFGPQLIDPALSGLTYDEQSWLHVDEVAILSELLCAWQRVDQTLRCVTFGNESGSEKGTFTEGLQTYLFDANYICEASLLLGNLTMTLRSLRDIMPCFLVLAVRMGFAYGLLGEDNLEARHHVQHKLTRRVTGGGRKGATKLEREFLCLRTIILMEKLGDHWDETILHESLLRHLGTMEQLETKGFRRFARFPSWRHGELPQNALFGTLPEELLPPPPKKKASDQDAPEAEQATPKRQRSGAESPTASPIIPMQVDAATRQAAAANSPFGGSTSSLFGAGPSLPHSRSPSCAGGSQLRKDDEGGGSQESRQSESQLSGAGASIEPGGGEDGGEGGAKGGGDSADESGGESDTDGGDVTQLVEIEEEEEAERQDVIDVLTEASGSSPSEAGSAAQPAKKKLPTLELTGLKRVYIGGTAYDVGVKRELKLVGHHSKVKLQADLEGKGLHRLHLPFASICGLYQPEVEEAQLRAVSFDMCKAPELDVWDGEKLRQDKAGKSKGTKGDWASASGFGVMTRVTFIMHKESAVLLWKTLAEDPQFLAYQGNGTAEAPADYDLETSRENEKARSTAAEQLLIKDNSEARRRGMAALQAQRSHTSMGMSPKRVCDCCGKEWWAQRVFVLSDRKSVLIPTKEMTVPTAQRGAVQMVMPVVSDGAGGAVLHVECGLARSVAYAGSCHESLHGPEAMGRRHVDADPHLCFLAGRADLRSRWRRRAGRLSCPRPHQQRCARALRATPTTRPVVRSLQRPGPVTPARSARRPTCKRSTAATHSRTWHT